MFAGARLELVESIEQVQRVLHPEVVRIAFKGALQALTGACRIAAAQLVDAQHAPRAPGDAVLLQSAARELNGLRVLTLLHAQFRQRDTHFSGNMSAQLGS